MNAAFVFVVACLWCRSTVQAWRDEEIKGMTGSLVAFYLAWSLYAVWLFFHLSNPISGYLFGFLAGTQTLYLFSYWIFAGPINYDRPRDRARLWFLFRIRRLGILAAAAVEENADMPRFASGGYYEPKGPLPLVGEHVTETVLPRCVLPLQQCNTCGFETHHDLDGHCMICDTRNKGA